jgi:hypothetical protein|tara:strand:+ start:146 stop:280 length:135 start_codon:yes stop_codon:yes gene_type:complete
LAINDLKTNKVVTMKFTSEGQLKDEETIKSPEVKKGDDNDSSDD